MYPDERVSGRTLGAAAAGEEVAYLHVLVHLQLLGQEFIVHQVILVLTWLRNIGQ